VNRYKFSLELYGLTRPLSVPNTKKELTSSLEGATSTTSQLKKWWSSLDHKRLTSTIL